VLIILSIIVALQSDASSTVASHERIQLVEDTAPSKGERREKKQCKDMHLSIENKKWIMQFYACRRRWRQQEW